MRLYNANFSPNALRVRAVAFELGMKLEIIEVDIRSGDNRAEDFLRRNPNAKPPVLAQSARSCDFGQVEERCRNGLTAMVSTPENPLPE